VLLIFCNKATPSRWLFHSHKEGWSPYLSLEDVRVALRRGDLESAARLSRVFTLTPVAV
jgi:hypothetical protein